MTLQENWWCVIIDKYAMVCKELTRELTWEIKIQGTINLYLDKM